MWPNRPSDFQDGCNEPEEAHVFPWFDSYTPKDLYKKDTEQFT